MVGVADITGFLIIVLVNSALAALLTRFLRVRMNTEWGSLLYTLLIVPVTLAALIPLYSLVLGGFVEFGDTVVLIGVSVVLPGALGIAFDYFWMPDPDEVELPQQTS